MSPDLAVGIVLCLVFLAFAALMYTGKISSIIALPLMASALYLVAAAFYPDLSKQFYGIRPVAMAKGFFTVVVSEGMPKLWHYMVAVMLGAIMAEQLKSSGASKVIIKWAGELGGDNPTAVCFLLVAACAILFTSLGGLGSVIMVASIVLPLMLALGVSAEVAGCLFLFGLCLGGTLNPVNWQFYIDFLKASAQMTHAEATSKVLMFVLPIFGLFLIITILFILFNTRRGSSSFWAVSTQPEDASAPNVGALGLMTPLVPIVILIPCNVWTIIKFLKTGAAGWVFPVNAALLIGVIYGMLAMPRPSQGRLQGLTKNIFDAVAATAPVAAVVIGIGMIIRVVWDPTVSYYMKPILEHIVPGSKVMYIVLFSVLAPLALYRGPLNVWGMGSAMATLMMATGKLPPVAIMAMLMAVGQIQGVSDPTNTHNVWLAGYLGTDVQSFTKKTIPYTWALAIAGLVVAAFLFVK